MRSSILVLTLASASANALSTSCTTQVAALALGDLGSCLQLTSLLPVLTDSGSIVTDLNTYLKTLCASSTTTCSNSTLTSAAASVSSGCSTDISGGGTDGAEVDGLLAIIDNYPEVHSAACSTNSTTGDYCVTDVLNTVQTDTGANVTVSLLTSLLSGDSSALSSLESAFAMGNLCTGCVEGIYYEALKANATIASTSIGSAVVSQCGSSFGQTAPSTISTETTSSSAASTATSSAATSGSRAEWSSTPVVVGAVWLACTLAGAAIVL